MMKAEAFLVRRPTPQDTAKKYKNKRSSGRRGKKKIAHKSPVTQKELQAKL